MGEPHPKIADSVLDLVGSTPMVRLSRVGKRGATVVGKLEVKNPGASVKDRPALAMVRAAEAAGLIGPGSVIVEATSGNTGISLAMIAAVRGYRCVLVMPEDMSLERRYVLRAYGAEIVLTPGDQGMAGAVAKAEQIARETPRSFMARQFANPANPHAHEMTTAREILDAVGDDLVAFVAGVGTGGHDHGRRPGAQAREARRCASSRSSRPRAPCSAEGRRDARHPGAGRRLRPRHPRSRRSSIASSPSTRRRGRSDGAGASPAKRACSSARRPARTSTPPAPSPPSSARARRHHPLRHGRAIPLLSPALGSSPGEGGRAARAFTPRGG